MNINSNIATISVNDLNDKLYEGEYLSSEELNAISNFEKFRLSKLNAVDSDDEFKLVYHKIQVMANVSPYVIFLDLNHLDSDFVNRFSYSLI